MTIHYDLQTTLTESAEIRALVESLHQAAVSLAFERVGPVREFRDQDADYERSGQDPKDRWLKIQASRHLDVNDRNITVKPRHIVAFTVQPGAGCEPANFGFCRYPAHIEVEATGKVARRHATGLDGWRWGSFCKTQYASDPNCGGIENFLRCHVGLVRLLDLAVATNMVTVDVDDESGYWTTRDPKDLVDTVGNWNEFIAAFAGSIKDTAERQGMTIEAAIAGFPNFEHLEAKGLERLNRPQGD
jgi:hypothetical protein